MSRRGERGLWIFDVPNFRELRNSVDFRLVNPWIICSTLWGETKTGLLRRFLDAGAPDRLIMQLEDTHNVIQVKRNGDVSDEVLFRTLESLEEENIQNLEFP
jgi:oligoribonuclease NrnB/cAMP/cGMP phosphodiesterase (DHH superfamily)